MQNTFYSEKGKLWLFYAIQYCMLWFLSLFYFGFGHRNLMKRLSGGSGLNMPFDSISISHSS